jgi:hypothetical protein
VATVTGVDTLKPLKFAAVVILLLSSCTKEKESGQVDTETEISTSEANDTIGLLPAEVPATLSDSASTYQYSARFPRTGESVVDTLIEQFVRAQIDSFLLQAPKELGNSNWISELDINYSSSTFPPHVLCYKLDRYVFTGGAHGLTSVTTMIFDMDKIQLLQLSDLFLPRAHFAESLSVMSRAELRINLGNMLNDDMLNSGTVPKPGNFSRFMLAPRDLVIFFEQYAVAPYAAGVQVVTIPLARLAPILKPEFRPVVKSASNLSRSGE